MFENSSYQLEKPLVTFSLSSNLGLCYATNAEALSNMYQDNYYVNVFKDVFKPSSKSEIKKISGSGDDNSVGLLLNSHYYAAPSATEDKLQKGHSFQIGVVGRQPEGVGRETEEFWHHFGHILLPRRKMTDYIFSATRTLILPFLLYFTPFRCQSPR